MKKPVYPLQSTPIMSQSATGLPDRSKNAPTVEKRISEVVAAHEISRLGGLKLASQVNGIAHETPALGKRISEGFSNDLGYTTLGYRELALNSISQLVASGITDDQLETYVEAALNHGAPKEEIIDVLNLAAGHVGASRSINALRASKDILAQSRKPGFPASYSEYLVRLNDHETLVRDTGGSGVPIILIHCVSLDGSFWREVHPSLAANGTRVIAYDVRGHGRARAAPLTQGLAHLSADLALLLDTFGFEQADIYGSSYGGIIGQSFALDYPKRVRSFAALATTSKAQGPFESRATRAEANGIDSLLAETMIRWFLPESLALDTWFVRYSRASVRRMRVEDWAASWRTMASINATERLHELTIPVLALSGTKDASSTPAIMKTISDSCTNAKAEFVSIEEGTHMMVMERPKPVAEALIAFRKKVDSLA